MCGICGYAGLDDPALVDSMMAAMAHRGPDAEGRFLEAGIGLGHKRLSIIDLEGGHQPMFNEDESLVLVCNGEIYNHDSLRSELETRRHRFRTRSDSEVLLHLYEEFGPDCVHHLSGMYAFAIYDRRKRELFIARDRLGIKPLYYAALPNGRFLFASEIKALLRYPAIGNDISTRAVHEYLALRYAPGPGTMFEEIDRLPAGCRARVRGGEVEIDRYWQPEIFDGPFQGGEADYLEGLAEHFDRSVDRRLMSDVPVGAYLSGGIDSSLIAASFAARSSSPIHTFSVGFDYEHDELGQAADTARMLGSNHTEIACGVDDIALLPEVLYHLDEPVGDPIVLPLFRLARVASENVTVVLTGEGADELLGGYLFHRVLRWGGQRGIPAALATFGLGAALRATPHRLLNLAFDYPADLGPRGKQKLMGLAPLLRSSRIPEAYRHLVSLFEDGDLLDMYTPDFRASMAPESTWQEEIEALESDAPVLNRAIHLQFAHWLPELMLTKQDKLTMASGVEARVPFLDHELVEYALQVPPALKIRRGQTKYLLRRLGDRLLPPEVTNRPKMPFYVPVEKWVRNPAFQDFVAHALDERTVRERGIFRPDAIRVIRDRALSGGFVDVKQVFSLTVLEMWLQSASDRLSGPI